MNRRSFMQLLAGLLIFRPKMRAEGERVLIGCDVGDRNGDESKIILSSIAPDGTMYVSAYYDMKDNKLHYVRRDGRVAEGTALLTRRTDRFRGFESHSLRQIAKPAGGGLKHRLSLIPWNTKR